MTYRQGNSPEPGYSTSPGSYFIASQDYHITAPVPVFPTSRARCAIASKHRGTHEL